jgi:hypothetical protein
MNFIKPISKFALFLLSVYAITAAYAYATQTVVNPSDISDDYICIKDTLPDAYICMPKSKDPIPWFLEI